MTYCLALISRDPGATNQMVAVWWLAQHLGHDHACQEAEQLLYAGHTDDLALVAMSYRYGLTSWRQADHPALDLEGETGSPEDVLRRFNVSMLVTGLDDLDARLSRRYWRAARTLGIPVIALTDNQENLSIRCRDDLGAQFWPDAMLLSHGGEDALLAAGCPPESLFNIPDLHRKRLEYEAVDHGTLHHVWQVEEGENVILFASECTREIAPLRTMDYDEITVLENLIKALENGQLPDGTPAHHSCLVIRPHPRDTPGKYDHYCANKDVHIIVSTDGTPVEAIMSADLIVGMASAFLDEAKLLGQPVKSLLNVSSNH